MPQPPQEIGISAVTIGDIRVGLALLPNGRRKSLLTTIADIMFQEDFGESCVPYDAAAAEQYAAIVASRTRAGRLISVEDVQVAAIARSAGLALATRNTKDFAGIDGLALVNPWDA